ncbi:MAG: hypothetical protein ABI406_14835 [Ktedonobacteraceae bacterium]
MTTQERSFCSGTTASNGHLPPLPGVDKGIHDPVQAGGSQLELLLPHQKHRSPSLYNHLQTRLGATKAMIAIGHAI